jgi:hypothetical protein
MSPRGGEVAGTGVLAVRLCMAQWKVESMKVILTASSEPLRLKKQLREGR